ncbi:MAG: hypothetical protein IJB69_05595 [Clostridia bacterium]|nr:hypothetical protein [Clostridia bacterium]
MKVHLFNFLLLITVLGCLCITLSRSAPEARPVSQLQRAFVTVAPAPTPHPIDAYRQSRTLRRQETLSALEALLTAQDTQLSTAAQAQIQALASAAETEAKVEGLLLGLGYEKSVCILDGGTVTLFTQPAVADADTAAVLQSAADLCRVSTENVQLLVP